MICCEECEESEEGGGIADIFSQVLSNRALVNLKLKNNRPALRDCSKAIEKNINNVKARYRKAQALMCLGGLEEGLRECGIGVERCEEEKVQEDFRNLASKISRKIKIKHDKELSRERERREKDGYFGDIWEEMGKRGVSLGLPDQVEPSIVLPSLSTKSLFTWKCIFWLPQFSNGEVMELEEGIILAEPLSELFPIYEGGDKSELAREGYECSNLHLFLDPTPTPSYKSLDDLLYDCELMEGELNNEREDWNEARLNSVYSSKVSLFLSYF